MLLNRNNVCYIYNFTFLMHILKKKRESGEIKFNNLFYLAQYILKVSFQHAILSKITEIL